MFRRVFKINQDEDFANHISTGRQAVHDFENGRGIGPDPEDLHFNMRGPFNSAWNEAVIGILVEKFQRLRDAQVVALRLPGRSTAYVSALLVEKFKRCRGFWTAYRPGFSATGQMETPEEVEVQVTTKKEAALKTQRHATRHLNVRLIVSGDEITNGLIEIPQTSGYHRRQD
jgi:hypothetical protein